MDKHPKPLMPRDCGEEKAHLQMGLDSRAYCKNREGLDSLLKYDSFNALLMTFVHLQCFQLLARPYTNERRDSLIISCSLNGNHIQIQTNPV